MNAYQTFSIKHQSLQKVNPEVQGDRKAASPAADLVAPAGAKFLYNNPVFQ